MEPLADLTMTIIILQPLTRQAQGHLSTPINSYLVKFKELREDPEIDSLAFLAQTQ